MQLQLEGQATDEQIQAWKEKFGKIFKYEVDGKVCYLRPVDRQTFALAAAKIQTGGVGKFNETVVKEIWLGGCEDIRTIDGLFFGLSEMIDELMKKRKGELGEL